MKHQGPWLAYGMLYWLNVADAVLTIMGIKLGIGQEGNPAMAWLMELDPTFTAFLAVKLVVGFGFLYALQVHVERYAIARWMAFPLLGAYAFTVGTWTGAFVAWAGV